ncbi:TVP38/TMEM64 family protein [Paenibacillus sp. Soil724D2]|uniref:TVP38/TMEM64 family protein n=1 Tax=Paenibacillus sp. (strain Soil724D2) TaxID=1736392 RepID=UPI000715B35E|nr:TVP38/TMEM64 family protein [Paenibacillus sp. Soil724D2]KRE46501.1 SNARE associated Golgi family protein [Paenibacillus sp. Soil724D2]
MKPRSWLLLFIVVIGGLLWLNYKVLHLGPDDIRSWILSFGWAAPVLFIFIYAVRPLILFPASVLSLTGGLAFGPMWGTVYTIVGATMGAVLSFWLARFLGNKLVSTRSKEKWGKLEKQLQQKGFIYILLLRLIPLFPFDLISYGAGVAKVNFSAFLFGTLLGIIPGTFAYSFLGSSFLHEKKSYIVIAVIVFVLVTLIPLVFKKRVVSS